MAINRGPWNALIDDDGSNLVGSIWNKDAIKTVLLDPIDAQIASGPWTPVDASGAGLVITVSGARYWKFDKLVTIVAELSFPTTSNGVAARLGGFPFANGAGGIGGLYPVWVHTAVYVLGAGATSMTFHHVTTGAGLTNAQCSAQPFWIAGFYLTD